MDTLPRVVKNGHGEHPPITREEYARLEQIVKPIVDSARLPNDRMIQRDELMSLAMDRAIAAHRRADQNRDGYASFIRRAANWAISRAQRRRAGDDSASMDNPFFSGKIVNHDSSPLEALSTADQATSLLSGLSSFERDIIDMRFTGGMTYKDIGDRLGLHRASAYNQISKVIKKMRDAAGVK